MRRTTASWSLVLTLSSVLLGQTGCLLVPDDPVTAEPAANLRPSVRIDGGTVTADPDGTGQVAQFSWSGVDVDGAIDFYEWAVDDIHADGAWHRTTANVARFRVPVEELRTGTPRDPALAAWHTFYIRAIDDASGCSEPDKRYFNAWTIAPTSRITFPILSEGSPVGLWPAVTTRWEGEDLDSSRPDAKPLAYEYKLARLAMVPAPVESYLDSLRHGRNLLDSLGLDAGTRWIRVPSATTQLALPSLPSSGAYVFGVQAVDEAGVIEPVLDYGRNYFVLACCAEQIPLIEVREGSLGTFRFPVDGQIWQTDVPSGVPLRFMWTGDASHYGSRTGMVNYGFDIPDPGDESLHDPHGIGGWIGWGYHRGTERPVTYGVDQGGTTHYLCILMRDINQHPSSTRRCVVRMKIVPFTFTKTALVVDDARFTSVIHDADHDAFLDRTVLRRLRSLGPVDDLPIWRAYQEAGTAPARLRLEELADYQAIVWSLNLGASVHNGLGVAENEAALASYVKAGGRLFMFGTPIVGMNRKELVYPLGPPETAAGQSRLYFRFLYMRDEIVSGTRSSGDACYAIKSGLVAARSAHPAFPDLFLDPAKWDPELIQEGDYKGGVRWEGNMASLGQEPTPYAGLDTLYTVETWNRSVRTQCGVEPSPVEGAIISARYQSTAADTLSGRQHGRVLWIDIQPWWFQEDRLLDAGTAAVNWLFTGREQ